MKPASGVVSVILVNFRGTDDTITAINSLKRLDWSEDRLEIIVVENGSGDGSADRIAAEAPDIKLVRSKKNLGFAGGSNLGVQQSSGEYLAFLNNDARPDRAWIANAIRRFEESPSIGAVASRVLDWEGNRVDFIDAAVTWFGMGYKPLTGEPVPQNEPGPHDVLFGTGSAMFVRRDVFERLGGFDERYFMFFEDVDLGWRLNLGGWRFVYEPTSTAYHKHHASMSSLGAFKETYLLERNALFTLYKNLDDASLGRQLAATLLLSARRAVDSGHLDPTELDIRKSDGNDVASLSIPKSSVASIYAMDQFVEALPGLAKSRREIQAGRVASEAQMARLFGDMDAPSFADVRFLEGYENLVNTFDVLSADTRSRVLIITGDPIGPKMAGPAIRAWHMAQALSHNHAVTLVTLSGQQPVEANFDIVHVRPGDQRGFAQLEREHDIIVFQGHAMALFDALRETEKVVVVDIYDPMHLEQLEQGRELGTEAWNRQVSDATEVLNEQLSRGDFFLCASERQRHFFLGQLAALGRINPSNYADDPDLSKLISIVPFGLEATPPTHQRDVLKGVVPGIVPSDKVVLWSGGLYNWFDPATLIRAIAQLRANHSDVKLFFLGTKHPHPGVPEMAIVADSRALARELGLLDVAVFFNDSWVDYADRGNYLTEASVGVSTHFEHVETTFSFRTRILDYLWAELPMVVTEGDHFADLVASETLGLVVRPKDVDSLAEALERVLYDEEFASLARTNIHRVRAQYEWGTTLKPLTDFMEAPHRAADSRGDKRSVRIGAVQTKRRKKHGLRHDVTRAMYYLRNGGPTMVIRKLRRRFHI